MEPALSRKNYHQFRNLLFVRQCNWKIAAQKEIAQAQQALLGGKMSAFAMHLSRAMHAGTMNSYRSE